MHNKVCISKQIVIASLFIVITGLVIAGVVTGLTKIASIRTSTSSRAESAPPGTCEWSIDTCNRWHADGKVCDRRTCRLCPNDSYSCLLVDKEAKILYDNLNSFLLKEKIIHVFTDPKLTQEKTIFLGSESKLYDWNQTEIEYQLPEILTKDYKWRILPEGRVLYNFKGSKLIPSNKLAVKIELAPRVESIVYFDDSQPNFFLTFLKPDNFQGITDIEWSGEKVMFVGNKTNGISQPQIYRYNPDANDAKVESYSSTRTIHSSLIFGLGYDRVRYNIPTVLIRGEVLNGKQNWEVWEMGNENKLSHQLFLSENIQPVIIEDRGYTGKHIEGALVLHDQKSGTICWKYSEEGECVTGTRLKSVQKNATNLAFYEQSNLYVYQINDTIVMYNYDNGKSYEIAHATPISFIRREPIGGLLIVKEKNGILKAYPRYLVE